MTMTASACGNSSAYTANRGVACVARMGCVGGRAGGPTTPPPLVGWIGWISGPLGLVENSSGAAGGNDGTMTV